jgi:2-amino-4-ketopentanoate thiolase alpha subunit
MQVVLPAGERSPHVPPDTAAVDFVARVRGFLISDCEIGSVARIRTLADREVKGMLAAVSPRNPADFGNPVPELLRVGRTARQALSAGSRRS